MAGIRLMPAQVVVMTVLYKSVKSTDYIGNDIGVVARGVSRARNETYIVAWRDSRTLERGPL